MLLCDNLIPEALINLNNKNHDLNLAGRARVAPDWRRDVPGISLPLSSSIVFFFHLFAAVGGHLKGAVHFNFRPIEASHLLARLSTA